MKPDRAEQLQPPVATRRVQIRRVPDGDPRRRRRVLEILLDILDTAGTPEEGRRP